MLLYAITKAGIRADTSRFRLEVFYFGKIKQRKTRKLQGASEADENLSAQKVPAREPQERKKCE
jgi:hypothetical protein